MDTGDQGASDSLNDAVLWEMVEEHLDELGFCFSQHQRAHSNPLLRLAELIDPPWFVGERRQPLEGGSELSAQLGRCSMQARTPVDFTADCHAPRDTAAEPGEASARPGGPPP